ncbi:PAS domain S-box protein [Roseospira navarrensis]|nr:PAS domain S-box protein [Roseospira navarrensis]
MQDPPTLNGMHTDALEYLDTPACLFDETFRLVYVNPAYARFFGRPAEALVGRRFTELIPEDDRARTQTLVRGYDILEPTGTHDHPVTVGPDDTRLMRWTNTVIRTADSGRPTLYMGVGRDITNEALAEARRADCEIQYQALFTQSLNGVAIHEMLFDDSGAPCDYVFLDVNPAFERLTGLNAAHVIGRRVRELLPETEPFWIERYGQVCRTGTPVRFEAHSGALEGDYQVSAFPLGRSRFAVSFVDISEVKKAQDDLRAAFSRFDLAMKGANDGLFDWNLQTNEIYYSPRWKSMLGYAPDELADHFSTWEDLVDPDDREKGWAMLNDYIEGRRDTFNLEFRMRHKDGHWMDILSRAFLERDATGAPVRLVGTHVDISERKQFERELQTARLSAESATKAKSEFLAAMSHELRTPLNSIIGFADMMNHEVIGPLPPHYREYADLISSSGLLLLETINSILDLAKIEAGKLDLTRRATDVADLIDEVLSLLSVQAESKRLLLRRAVPDALMLSVDPMRIKQVLFNIVGNAIKFTDSGAVEVAHIEDETGHWITVTDSGIGMTPAQIQVEVTPFGQAHGDTLARSYQGTGLGLSLSLEIMRLHGGRLDIDSTPGQGTRVMKRMKLFDRGVP